MKKSSSSLLSKNFSLGTASSKTNGDSRTIKKHQKIKKKVRIKINKYIDKLC